MRFSGIDVDEVDLSGANTAVWSCQRVISPLLGNYPNELTKPHVVVLRMVHCDMYMYGLMLGLVEMHT